MQTAAASEAAASPRALRTAPLHPRYGLEVDARIDRAVRDPAVLGEIEALYREQAVLIFRRQSLAEAELVAFTERFGACEIVSRADIMSPYHREIIYFSTLRYADGRTVGGFAGGEEVDWHSDQTFRPDPATGALSYGAEVPPEGGRFYWANQYLAFELLSPEVQRLIDGRNGVYSYAKRLGAFNPTELAGRIEALKREHPPVRHPVVLVHPRTGRRALYADPSTLIAVEGLSDAENAEVLPLLERAAIDPSVVLTHEMAPGDLLMWDNGCVLHRRDPVDARHPRLLKRTTFRVPRDAHCVPH